MLRIRSVVVLPAPLGPSSPKIAPGLALEGDVRDRGDPAPLIVEERLAEPFNLDHESAGESARHSGVRQPAIASTAATDQAGSSSMYS